MKKTIWTTVLFVAVLLILAGAAYLAPRLIHPPAAANLKPGPAGRAAGPGAGEVSVTHLPSEELPQREYDLAGMVSRVQDNSIYIEPAFLAEKEVEIVVTQETKIFVYIGQETLSEDADGNPSVTHTLLEPATADEIVVNDILSVWADKRGDRYIAEAIRVMH